jgi:hypothetical protein
MKIFQIGFNRCGTTSIFQFFESHCLNRPKCVHWEQGNLALTMLLNMKEGRPLLEGQYEDFDVYTDMQALVQDREGNKDMFLAHMEFEILDRQYPGSRFILNTRNVDDWIRSRTRHYRQLGLTEIMERIYGKDFEGTWRRQWKEHHENVTKYFEGRNDLLVYDIDKDKAAKIADFLPELTFDDRQFPKINWNPDFTP